jgi:hypothetical protein
LVDRRISAHVETEGWIGRSVGYRELMIAVILLKPYKDQYLDEASSVRDTISISYQHGAASLLDFLNAQADYRSVQVNYLNLVASYLNATNQGPIVKSLAFFCRRQHPGRIQNKRQFRSNMNERCEQRIEQSSRSHPDADAVHDEGSIEILEDDGPALSCDANRLDELFEIVSNQDDVGAFASDIRARAHGYTNCCLAECGRIIDPITQHGHRSSVLCMSFYFDGFLLR